MKKHYEIFADYHQFYLWDHGESPEPPIDYDDDDIKRRIKAAPFVVVIQPERNMNVQVTIEVRDTAPIDDFDAWDHVAEASLDLPSGRLEIHECTGGSIDILDLPPGPYRIRSHHAGFATLSQDRLEGNDHYTLSLWPAPLTPIKVLKQYPDAW